MRAADICLTEARSLVLSTDRDRELLMPHFSARSHAGRVSASAHVWPRDESELNYRTDIRLSGVRFGSLLIDLGREEEAVAPPEDPWAVADDRSRGEVDAGITLAGIVGKPETRRGSGVIEVLGGNVLRLPNLIVRLIEVSNLQPPANEKLDYAKAQFFYRRRVHRVRGSLGLLSNGVDPRHGVAGVGGPRSSTCAFTRARRAGSRC